MDNLTWPFYWTDGCDEDCSEATAYYQNNSLSEQI